MGFCYITAKLSKMHIMVLFASLLGCKRAKHNFLNIHKRSVGFKTFETLQPLKKDEF
jgi:hypothetical protein